tara:strand:+ start:34307 stop:35017 length:711 start_codon:yes stop_codon:yes gene_type:complete
MKRILITGANRGLGLEFVRQYQSQNIEIHACCRDSSSADELQALASSSGGKTIIHKMDVQNPDEINSVASELKGIPIDGLINNAGILGTNISESENSQFGSIDYESWHEVMSINVFGPVRVSEAFVGNVLLSDKKLMIFISTHMASITNLSEGGFYQYRSSKAALNLIVKGLSLDLKGQNIRTLALHPGWVKTDMGSDSAPVEIVDSISGMLKVIDSFHSPRTAEFINYDGTPYPW